MVAGTRDNAQALLTEVAVVLAPLGLNLSPQKTRVVHVNEGFDFLGFHIRRRRKRGTDKWHTYTYPSRKALRSVRTKVRGLTCRSTTSMPPWLMLGQVSAIVRGWASYFRHGVSKACFGKLDTFVWRRFTRWLRKRHPHVPWRRLEQ
jgi:RNA-directed DNA polymerase